MRRKPSLPRYASVWDVNIVLKYLKQISNDEMSLKDITLKLTMLPAVLTGQRCQTIHLLDISNISSYLMTSVYFMSSSLVKGYDPLYSSSPLASLDGFSRSHGDGLYVIQLVVAATNQNALYKKHMFCRKNVNKIKMRVHIK